MPYSIALSRLNSTRRENSDQIQRISWAIERHIDVIHYVGFMQNVQLIDGTPFFQARTALSIIKNGLRIKNSGDGAVHGTGAYCFPIDDAPKPGNGIGKYYLKLRIGEKNAVEMLTIPGVAHKYLRIMSPHGDLVAVKLLETNIPQDALQAAGEF